MIRTLYTVGLILLLTSCNPYSDTKQNDSKGELTGTYHFVEDSGSVMLRNWGKRYWELCIDKKQSRLSYFETGRGLNGFDLAVDIKEEDDFINVKFDSIISKAYLPPIEVETLKTGDPILTMHKINNGFETNSDFIYVTQSDSVLKTKVKFMNIDNTLH